ncbi:MopE-related protein [Sandaracinus amylolyticus]|uniref:MopE-related protein n=1 Tax=Sandaracinus amylolyticus TaxID=927083 RepID=UPI001F362202|nr:MopE-related protein [Sandaracinus amylolyticus]
MRPLFFASAPLFFLVTIACGESPAASEPDAGTDASAADASLADAPSTCASDDACDDDTWCNGTERCAPSTPGADARGCVTGDAPCAADSCDESADRCDACDADGDGSEAMGCGGDDCDDDDRQCFPGNTEVCDAEAHDEDCRQDTFGELDRDRDGWFAATCCNVSGEGVRTCGDDCADDDPEVHPTEAEMCNRRDDDCDGGVDERACEVPVAVSSDSGHACAVSALGTVWCWGRNNYGQLGDGTQTDRSAAVSVAGLTGVVELDLDGIGYTCARTSGGDVHCWGGDDTCGNTEPVAVMTGTDVVDIDMFYYEMCAVRRDGSTACVSFDYDCATSTTTRCGAAPSDAVQVAVGADFCCWRRRSGAVQCVGSNTYGQLGDGSITDAVDLDAGAVSACAVRGNGTVVCWGDNEYDQLGRGAGAPAMSASPAAVATITSGATQVSVRSQDACALVGGEVRCWGRDFGGTPEVIVDADATQISAGTGESCAVIGEGVYCWSEAGTPRRVSGIP